MNYEEEAARLIAIADIALKPDAVLALAETIAAYCRRASMTTTDFGSLAVAYPGFYGNMVRRMATRARMRAAALAFIERNPTGVHAAIAASVAAQAQMMMEIVRADRANVPPRANAAAARKIPSPAMTMAPIVPVSLDREPCWRCGVRGDIGCGCR